MSTEFVAGTTAAGTPFRIVAAIDDGEELAEEVQTFVPEARFVSKIIGELPTMRILCHRMVILFANLRGHEQDPDVVEAIIESMGKLHHRLTQLYKKLGLVGQAARTPAGTAASCAAWRG